MEALNTVFTIFFTGLHVSLYLDFYLQIISEETSPMQTNETNQENETSEVKDQISSESEFMKPDEETNREEDIAVDKVCILFFSDKYCLKIP